MWLGGFVGCIAQMTVLEELGTSVRVYKWDIEWLDSLPSPCSLALPFISFLLELSTVDLEITYLLLLLKFLLTWFCFRGRFFCSLSHSPPLCYILSALLFIPLFFVVVVLYISRKPSGVLDHWYGVQRLKSPSRSPRSVSQSFFLSWFLLPVSSCPIPNPFSTHSPLLSFSLLLVSTPRSCSSSHTCPSLQNRFYT